MIRECLTVSESLTSGISFLSVPTPSPAPPVWASLVRAVGASGLSCACVEPPPPQGNGPAVRPGCAGPARAGARLPGPVDQNVAWWC